MSVSPSHLQFSVRQSRFICTQANRYYKTKARSARVGPESTDGGSFPHTQKKKEGKEKIYYFDTKIHFPSLAFNALNAIFFGREFGKRKAKNSRVPDISRKKSIFAGRKEPTFISCANSHRERGRRWHEMSSCTIVVTPHDFEGGFIKKIDTKMNGDCERNKGCNFNFFFSLWSH